MSRKANPNMGAHSQRKGKEYEVEQAHWLTSLLGATFRRTPRSGGMRDFCSWDIFRVKGDRKSFTVNRETILDDVGIECKDVASLPKFVTDWIDECEDELLDSPRRWWFLIFHRPQTDRDFVLLPKEHFGRLIAALQREHDEHGG